MHSRAASESDVLIVGGGPAGASCAWALERAGLDVTVLDRARFPRDKVCAGWVTPAVLAELDVDVQHYAAGGRVLQPIDGFRVGLVGRSPVEVDYGEVVSYGIRRCELDHFLLERSGARLELGQPIRQIEKRKGRWLVNGRFEAPLLIGAGGHFCPVARLLGAEVGRGEAAVVAQEIELPLTLEEQSQCDIESRCPEIYFTADLRGYGWCFRKGDYLNVGLGRQDPDRLGEHVHRFVGALCAQGRVPERFQTSFKGHAYLLHENAQRTLTDDNVLLVGDAAGLAYSRSGEGIRPAVESALLAAEVICAAGGLYSAARLAPYEDSLERRFGPRGRSKAAAPPWWKRKAASVLLGQPWFCRSAVLDRWFLHRHQEPLPVAATREPGRQEFQALADAR